MSITAVAIAVVVAVPLLCLLFDLGRGAKDDSPEAAARRTERRPASTAPLGVVQHDEDLAYRRAAQSRR